MRVPILVVVGAVMISSSLAMANPIATEGLRARQAYETQHVQLSFFTMATTGPTKVERDGKELTVTWVKKSISLNTGSGVTGVDAYQICDCSPGVGQHSYKVYFAGAGNQGTQLESEVTVVASLPTPDKLDAGVLTVDSGAWNQPEPVPMQGIDCATTCAGGGGGVKGDTDDSGCSVGIGGGGAGLLALLILGLVGFVRRRA
jgi:MYXO-CTERM domain-containing protein